MDFEYIYPVLILFGSFAVMLAIGVPITFAIGLSSLLSIITALPPDAAISVISQKMTVGLDGFTQNHLPRITAFSVCRSYSATVITIIVFCKVI